MEFTEDEVRGKLEELGYHDVPQEKLLQFMADLDELIQLDLSGVASSVNEDDSILDNQNSTRGSLSQSVRSSMRGSPLRDVTMKVQRKAFAKEKVKPSMQHASFDKENMSLLESSLYNESLSSTLTSVDEQSKKSSSTKNLGMRRKVARKRDGSSRIFDESSTNDESDESDITLIEEQLKNIPVRDTDNLSTCRYGPASTYRKERPKSASSLHSVRPKSASSLHSERSESSLLSLLDSNALPSFIRPTRKHPHTKNLTKCDPVARYHQFNREWKHSKFPGESSHSTIRWSVREQMMHCEVFEKPRHQHSANNYVVPTEKKRQSLRWQVRTVMANMK